MTKNLRNDYDAEEEVTLEELEQSSMRWMSMLVFLVVFGFFALAWYAYQTSQERSAGQEEIIIAAEDGPYKVKPEDPGGMEIPHQDMTIYDTIGEPPKEKTVEQLLPQAEEPLVRRRRQAREAEGTEVWVKKNSAKQELLKPRPGPIREAPEINGVETITPSAPKVEHVPEEEPKRFMDMERDSETQESKPNEDSGVAERQVKTVSEPKPEPKPEIVSKPEPKRKQSPPTAKGSAEVQLAALGSRSEAEATWRKLSAKHGDILDGMEYRIIRAELSKGTFYRLRVTGLPNKDAARQLCQLLKTRNQSCLVP
jgi:hypothetical protein